MTTSTHDLSSDINERHRSLRVLIFLYGLSNHFGPGQQSVILAEALQLHGHAVRVVVERPVPDDNQYRRAFVEQGIMVSIPNRCITLAEKYSHLNEVIWLLLAPLRLLVALLDMAIRHRPFNIAWVGVRGRFNRFFPSAKLTEPCRWFAKRTLDATLASFQPDLVHTLSGLGCAFEWNKKVNLPLLHTEMAIATVKYGVDWWSDLRANLSAVDRIIAITDAVADGTRRYLGYDGPIDIIPHMLPDPASVKSAAQDALRTQRGADLLVIGTAARLDPMKGHRYLVEAATLIPERINVQRTVFWLAGDGPTHQDLAEQIQRMGLEERMILLGHLDPDQMHAFWDSIDLFVLPTLWEGFSVAVLEAMAHGKAVIASRVGGVPEVVDDGVTGLLVPPADPAALAAAIGRLLEQPAERHAMGLAGQRKFQANYRVDVVMEAQLAVYKMAIDSRELNND